MIISTKWIFRILPWLLIVVMVLTLYLVNHWPFGSKSGEEVHKISTHTVLQEVEALGKMELVKYHFSEILNYDYLSEGKVKGSMLMGDYDFDPDLSAVMVAAGEAAGCLDLTRVSAQDIIAVGDTLYIHLPAPELCYYKLDLKNTRIIKITQEGWWSRLFSDGEDERRIYDRAYKSAEQQIRNAALESGILDKTRENATLILKPMLEQISKKNIVLIFEPGGETMIKMK